MDTNRKLRRLWSVCLLSLMGLWASLAWAYNPPSGPNDLTADLKNPKTHGTIVLKAIEVLKNDGYTQMGGYFYNYRQQLLDGVRQADRSGGDVKINFKIAHISLPGVGTLFDGISVLTKEIPSNTFSHFYNLSFPNNPGLQLWRDKSGVEALLWAAEEIGLGDWEVYTLMGPHPAATDMCNWYYAQAVDAMRKGDVARAMTFLGGALHFVADLTVPQHATDRHGGYGGDNHLDYESRCDELIDGNPQNGEVTHATSAKDLGNYYANPGHHPPAGFVHHAASKSKPLLSATNAKQFDTVASQMIPLAEKLTAALLKRFYERWESEEFTMVVLRIDRVKALQGIRDVLGKQVRDPTRDVDPGGNADFYAKVKISGRPYQTSAIIDSDDMRPQVVIPFCWFFPQWIPHSVDSVPIRIEMWDEDGGARLGDDKVDVTPVGGRALDITYWLKDRRTTGDINATGPNFYSKGDDWDTRAEMWFHIDHFPTADKPGVIYTSVQGTLQTRDSKPAKGCYVFFRDTVNDSSKWQHVKVNENGQFTIPSLKMGTYAFRPAGSGFHFAQVPRVVKLQPGVNSLSFTAEPLLTQQDVRQPPTPLVTQFQPKDLYALAQSSLEKMDEKQKQRILEAWALNAKLPSGDFGVKDNGMGYVEKGTVFVHLSSIVDPKTQKPLLDTKSVTVIELPAPKKSGKETIRTIHGATTGPGVANATVRAILWLGNPLVGFRRVSEASGKTDNNGNISFTLSAGTHCEEAKISMEVVDNPVNPWCKPQYEREQLLLFKPAKQGDDKILQVAYRLTAPLTISSAARLSPLMAADVVFNSFYGDTGVDAETMTRAQDALDSQQFQRELEARRHAAALQADPQRLSALLSSLQRAQPTVSDTTPTGPPVLVIPKPISPPAADGRIVIEGESLVETAKAKGGPVIRQDMQSFGKDWSGNGQLFWRAPQPGDQPIRDWPWLTLKFNVPKDQTYRLILYFTQAPDYGDALVFVDGKRLGALNGYSQQVRLRRVDLGEVNLKAGSHEMMLVVSGKDSGSSNYFLGIDKIELLQH